MKIAFIGKMRSGKDTAAEYLLKYYCPDALFRKFADPIYEIEATIYNYLDYPIPEDKTKRRKLLQFIGTDFGRELDPDIWIKQMDNSLRGLNKSIFITDCRFPNEVELLEKHGFSFIHIMAPESIRIERGATNLTHESEISLDDYPFCKLSNYFVVPNGSSLKNFYENLDFIYARMPKL